MRTDLLALGGDLGGTSTRILVVDGDGCVHGRGRAGGGNPISHPAHAAAAFGEALRAALDGVDASRVRTSVIGVAGGSALRRAPAAEQFEKAWSDAGLTCDPGYRPDLEVAFAAGTPEPDGAVLVAGTGASAGAVTGHRLTRTAGGHGWLLGDDGSGFWLGREAARATLRTLDAEESPGKLVASVLDQLRAAGPVVRQREQVIEAAYARPGVHLSELAPLVSAAYRDGDPQAVTIVERAGAELLGTLALIRDEDESGPIVLAGSLAGDESPVGAVLRGLLQERFAGAVLPARNGAGGAAWLALAVHDPGLSSPQVHARLCA